MERINWNTSKFYVNIPNISNVTDLGAFIKDNTVTAAIPSKASGQNVSKYVGSAVFLINGTAANTF